jgi:hypothetical protein
MLTPEGKMRYYVVDCELGVEKFRFMVRARSKAEARRHVTDKIAEATIASQDELVAWVAGGSPVETANDGLQRQDEP